jgi:hypothetical protein
MRKTGLCGVVIATLFGTAGLLQHPSHQVHIQHKQQSTSSPLAEAGVNLLNSYSDLLGLKTADSVTRLPDGFLQVMLKPGPSPAQIAAYAKHQAEREALFEHAQAEARAQAEAQAQAAAEAQAQAAAEAQAQAEAEAQAQAAAAQAQAAAAAAAQAQQSTTTTTSTAATGGVWLELRDCESGDNYATNTGNGYYGAYQFLLSTWLDLGFSGLPSNAPPAEQDEAAQELQARSGWGQWPACAAELGLT